MAINTDIDFDKIYEEISKYSDKSKKINNIESIEYSTVDFEDGIQNNKPHTEYKTIKEYLDSPMWSKEEATVKKLMAMASVMSGDDRTSQEIAGDIDNGVAATKVAYKVNTGELDVIEAGEILIDRAAAQLNGFLQKILDPFIISETVGMVVSCVYPPAQFVVPYIKIIVKNGMPVVKNIVRNGLRTLANSAKTILRVTTEWVKRKADKWAKTKAIQSLNA